ncbi:hypothetical protein [Proteus phage vB_PmiP_RS10pmA]|nr:hypothetical protein [Proteus phage vB_PmiP_RS10pmA]
MLKNNTGKSLSDVLDWYQTNYAECAIIHNGLVDSLSQ